MQEEIQFVDVNPLDEPVNEKRYTQGNINTSGIDMTKPIDEPTFTPPPFRGANTNNNSKTSSSSSKTSSQPSSSSSDEPMNKKDLKLGAEAAADMVIQGYVWLHDLGNKWLQISDKKLNALQESGEINLNAMTTIIESLQESLLMNITDKYQIFYKFLMNLKKKQENFLLNISSRKMYKLVWSKE